MLAVASGLARHVLCYRTLWESTYSEMMRSGDITPSGGRTTSWMMPFGASSAAHTLAQNAQRHFHRYGTTRETLGWIALNQRANAALNPTAIYRDPMTMDDYLSARPVTTPFGLYDCDVPCDGAVAVIVGNQHARVMGRHAVQQAGHCATDRQCPKCAERFYDLTKDDPVTCISCGNSFVPETVLKSKQPLPFEAAPVQAAPLTVKTGETWVFAIKNGEPASARNCQSTSTCGRVRCTACSARTAPASRP